VFSTPHFSSFYTSLFFSFLLFLGYVRFKLIRNSDWVATAFPVFSAFFGSVTWTSLRWMTMGTAMLLIVGLLEEIGDRVVWGAVFPLWNALLEFIDDM
jgi:hypothetical protein